MNVTILDYNNLSAANKAKVELRKVIIKNHPQASPGLDVVIIIPQVLFDLATS